MGLLVFMMATLTVVAMARTYSEVSSSIPALESATSAATLYTRYCVRCHGRDGSAKGIKRSLSGARNLTEPGWQNRVSDERIFNVISNGKGKMPSFSKNMSEAEIDSLVQFVRGLKKER
jgi:mono/diheme cytochrome c family protein